MPKDIHTSKVTLRQLSKVDVYQPQSVTKEGMYNGEEFYIQFEALELLPGVPVNPPTIKDLIVWDKAFYVSWEFAGFFTSFEVTVTEAGSEIFIGTTDEFNISLKTHLDNNVEYSLTISSKGGLVDQVSNVITFTLVSKVPTNVKLDQKSDTGGAFSWDSVSDVLGYEILVTDKGTGEQFSYTSDTNNIVIDDLTQFKSYTFKVRSVSQRSLFSSDYSNTVDFSTNSFAIVVNETSDKAKAFVYIEYIEYNDNEFGEVNVSTIDSSTYIDVITNETNSNTINIS